MKEEKIHSLNSLESYFQEFVDEFNKLLADGLVMFGHQITVDLESFICDAQVCCYLKVIVASNGYNSCERSKTEGKFTCNLILS